MYSLSINYFIAISIVTQSNLSNTESNITDKM